MPQFATFCPRQLANCSDVTSTGKENLDEVLEYRREKLVALLIHEERYRVNNYFVVVFFKNDLQEMQENVKKCKNFLATLIKLASHNSPSPETSKNVKGLVQDLLVSTKKPMFLTHNCVLPHGLSLAHITHYVEL